MADRGRAKTPKGKGKGKKGKKGKKKTKKDELAELSELNDQLTEEVMQLKLSNSYLLERLDAVIEKLLEVLETLPNKDGFSFSDYESYRDIPTDEIMAVMYTVLNRQDRMLKDSLEDAVEELETRVTSQSMLINDLMRTKLNYENALEDLNSCETVQAVRQKIRQIQLDFSEEDVTQYPQPLVPMRNVSPYPELNIGSSGFVVEPSIEEKARVISVPTLQLKQSRMVHMFDQVPIVPPATKLPADTHIRDMNYELKAYIFKELSVMRKNGADWRLLAERCGFPKDVVKHWVGLRLACPMARLFTEWGKSDAATVRMLHRHLSSPYLKQPILAKMVSDFYDVL